MADYKDIGQLNEEDVREALLSYIAQNCCYGKGTAREMRINEIKLTSGLHYVLESYCEKRLSSWHQDAYTGQLIDGPHNGHPPSVWQVPCTASNLFANESKYVEVPHTCTVMPCHLCHASGYNPCHQCMGRGWRRCSSCRGSGRGMHSTNSSGSSHCISCHGHGMKKCHTCQGEGMILCVVCQGYKQVRNYIRLKIDYTNHVSEYVIERTEMPDHLIKNVEGQVILQQQFAAVSPLIGFLDGEMVEASIKMINDDKASHANEYILQQRQTLRAVPVSEVHCMWKGSAGQFWVYGNERKIHAPDYPDKCCCGCSVL
ncbi:PREDICTED: protein SSUH2 homolog [Priapulus caudatus]|uniref:Protein SSUH2 homolog n=1 Tax=Priapulus caudatus TaxID=37621 RepID=A0ABM1F863_PRICU|nr:PREDICTED: protein SSUH2 homolog [Priapulus caudatus]